MPRSRYALLIGHQLPDMLLQQGARLSREEWCQRLQEAIHEVRNRQIPQERRHAEEKRKDGKNQGIRELRRLP